MHPPLTFEDPLKIFRMIRCMMWESDECMRFQQLPFLLSLPCWNSSSLSLGPSCCVPPVLIYVRYVSVLIGFCMHSRAWNLRRVGDTKLSDGSEEG